MSSGSASLTEPRIILFDLETLPNLEEALKVWCQLSQYPGKTMRATINSILCAGWKVFGQSKTHCIRAWEYESWDVDKNDDKAVCEALYDVLKDADAIVTHNGRRFDWKFFQTRLMVNGMKPLHKIPHIDTCQLAKSNLFLFNNKLDTVGEFLTSDRKMGHEGWDLWVKCHRNQITSLRKMEKYCKQDVDVLESVFKILRPFASNIPNHNHFNRDRENVCPRCGSTLIMKNGLRYTPVRIYQRYACKNCGCAFRTDANDQAPRASNAD